MSWKLLWIEKYASGHSSCLYLKVTHQSDIFLSVFLIKHFHGILELKKWTPHISTKHQKIDNINHKWGQWATINWPWGYCIVADYSLSSMITPSQRSLNHYCFDAVCCCVCCFHCQTQWVRNSSPLLTMSTHAMTTAVQDGFMVSKGKHFNPAVQKPLFTFRSALDQGPCDERKVDAKFWIMTLVWQLCHGRSIHRSVVSNIAHISTW